MENIIVSDNEHIGLIQLDRIKKMNALNTETLEEIVLTLESWQKQGQIRVAIIKGHHRAFSAGADLAQMVELNPMDQLKDQREQLWKRFNLIRFPIIAQVSGFCLGGGHELAMSCDFILAADNAKFGQPEINVGIMPGAGGTQRFTKTVGKSKAMFYALTGEMISAAEALELGMVAKVFPLKTLDGETLKVAEKLALKSPIASSLIKESINSSFNTHLDEGLRLERRNFYLTFSSEDQKEGMKAFLEKRSPNYQGK